jgi:hypothetical protein
MASRTHAAGPIRNSPAKKPFSAPAAARRNARHSPGNHGGSEPKPDRARPLRAPELEKAGAEQDGGCVLSSQCRCLRLCCCSSSLASTCPASAGRLLPTRERRSCRRSPRARLAWGAALSFGPVWRGAAAAHRAKPGRTLVEARPLLVCGARARATGLSRWSPGYSGPGRSRPGRLGRDRSAGRALPALGAGPQLCPHLVGL